MRSAIPAPQGLYDPSTSTTPAASPSSRRCRGRSPTTSSSRPSPPCDNLEHRGASGAEPDSGDGAGILTQVPDEFFRAVLAERASTCRRAGRTPSASPSCPTTTRPSARRCARSRRSPPRRASRSSAGATCRSTPTGVGATARSVMPRFRQLFVHAPGQRVMGMALERMAFCLRKRAEHEADVYFPSLSLRTIVYKGMLTTGQLEPFFPDLSDERFASRARARALAVLHQHLPVLAAGAPVPAHRAQRRDQHRQGQPQLDAAREAQLRQRPDPRRPRRGCSRSAPPGGSDSASFDEVLELLHLGGRTLPHAVLMMIPEAWENHAEMDPARRAFYEFHATLMEPWDGPADVAFTDGTVIGAVLDRNGLRPGRYWVTDDGLVVLATEVGVLDIDPARSCARAGCSRAGCSSSTPSSTASSRTTRSRPSSPPSTRTTSGCTPGVIAPRRPARARAHRAHARVVLRRQQTFGYTEEELRILVTPMASTGAEPIGSMGTDTPDRGALASGRGCCSTTSPSCSRRSPTRRWTRSARSSSPRCRASIGPEGNLLDRRRRRTAASSCCRSR